MASKGWKVVQAHRPMIMFRKGGNSRVTTAKAVSTPSSSAGAAAVNKPPGATGPNVVSLPTIDDSLLPLRFQRRQIDSKEIEYINRGGPEY